VHKRGRAGALAVLLVAALVAAFLVLRGNGDAGGDVFAVTGHPTGIAVAGGQVWVAAPDSGALTVLSARDGRRIEPPLDVGGAPARLALGANGVWVADMTRGTVIPVARGGERTYDPIPIGADVSDVALSAGTVWAVSSAEGVVRTIGPRGERIRTLTVGRDPVDAAADEKRVAVASAGDGTLTWIDAKARRVAGRARVGGVPIAVALAGDVAWVADNRGGTVARVNLSTGAVDEPVRVGKHPLAIAADADGVYVLCAGDRMVWHLDANGDLQWKREAGRGPTALALDATSVWVTDVVADAVIRLER
jgi:DNA-binding beta-propeller fold protein YncE